MRPRDASTVLIFCIANAPGSVQPKRSRPSLDQKHTGYDEKEMSEILLNEKEMSEILLPKIDSTHPF